MGHPFNSLDAPNGVTGSGTTGDVGGANNIIFVYGGTYPGGIVPQGGQQLIGQSQGLTRTVLETASGGNPLIKRRRGVANGNTIDGIRYRQHRLVLQR
jgi:hypothetical protein